MFSFYLFYLVILWLTSFLKICKICTLGESFSNKGVSYTTNESISDKDFTLVLSNSYSTTQKSLLDSNNSFTVEVEKNFNDCLYKEHCLDLPATCVTCDYSASCIYGRETEISCRVNDDVICSGPRLFNKTYTCMFCYQTPSIYHQCTTSTSCRVNAYPRQRYQANCSVDVNVFCLGKRNFPKMRICNWTSGKRWRTAFILSITVGGLGVDRFYLGLWKEGLGKLFSFGGVGVWTLVDIILIGTGYLTPADGSLYI